jgi:GT2 family glycosyltransferase
MVKRALHALSRQTLDPAEFEITVVDDGSADETPAVCRLLKQELPNLRYIALPQNSGTGNAANIGVESSKGDYLIFTDDDCIARGDWAERMREALAAHPLVAGSVATPGTNFIKDCHNIAEFHSVLKGRKAGPTEFIAGSNMGFRRSVFNEVGGFPAEKRSAPDTEFILEARSKGYHIYFTPDSVVIHDHSRTTFPALLRYSADHASETILLRNKFRSVLKTPFILRSPALIIAASPVIALRVTAGIYLRNRHNAKFIATAPFVYALKLAWCWGAARGLWASDRTRNEI